MVGIPFANRERIGGHWYARCPVCDALIELVEMKDWESHSGREYAEHYARMHETVSPP